MLPQTHKKQHIVKKYPCTYSLDVNMLMTFLTLYTFIYKILLCSNQEKRWLLATLRKNDFHKMSMLGWHDTSILLY